MDSIIYVGLDVRHVGVFANRPEILLKLAARLRKGGHRLSFCYEAGPCGYGLHRLLAGCGHECVVVAPSLIPVKVGGRVKTIAATGRCWLSFTAPAS